MVTPGGGRRASVAADLAKRGLAASDGPTPAGALLVAAAEDTVATKDGGGPHLAVLAGSKEGSDDMDQWVEALQGSPTP